MNNKAKQYVFGGTLLVVLFVLFYLFLFVGRTKVTINLPLPDTQVIIDREEMLIPKEGQNSIYKRLRNGEHEIIVNKEGYFPWTRKINLEEEILLEPFLISQSPSGQIITQNDSEYFLIKERIGLKSVPNETNPLFSSDGKISVWVNNDNEIIWKEGSDTGVVVKPQKPIRNLSFYKNQDNALLFGTEEGIYVIDLKESYGVRNFMPVYIGGNPDYILGENSDYIYVSDTNSLMIVVI